MVVQLQTRLHAVVIVEFQKCEAATLLAIALRRQSYVRRADLGKVSLHVLCCSSVREISCASKALNNNSSVNSNT